MAKDKSKALVYADFPEQVGVDRARLSALIEDLKNNEIEAHSLMVLRHGKVAFESYSFPYRAESPHAMYSVSKSFVSAAAGFAIDEGYFALDTKILDVFPEYRPEKPDEKLESMTVHHLLSMTAGKDVSVLSDKTKDRWVKDFFNSKWSFAPGEGWRYISENTYMMCVIIKKLTGMGIIDYLTPRLFEPLGFERRPFWELDPGGLEAGGWGLFITTRELARFILCLQQGGKFGGKQVLPPWWVEQATAHVVDNDQYEDAHSRAGYGYFFWRNAFENSYRADGMFSQFGIVFEDYDACVIFTASEVDEDKARCALFRHIPDIFTDPVSEEPEDADVIPHLEPLEQLAAMPRSVQEKFVEGKIIHFRKNYALTAVGFPLSMLSMATTYMSADKAGNIDNVVFRFGENECTMTWDEGKEHNTIVCGMDGKSRESRIHLASIDFTAVSSAAWVTERKLEVRMRPLESICERRITFEFNGNNVKAYPSSSPTLHTIAEYLSNGVGTVIPNKLIAEVGGKVMQKLDLLVEAPLNGTMV